MKQKPFALRADQIKPLAEGFGGCFASDRITVDGMKVGYMYREPADFAGDGGWRFMAGDESQDYMEDADHIQIYDVNTIANYDPQIIPHLNSPVGSAFERDQATGQFVPVESPDAD